MPKFVTIGYGDQAGYDRTAVLSNNRNTRATPCTCSSSMTLTPSSRRSPIGDFEPAHRESLPNGVRKITYRDGDGNEIGLGGAPQ